MPVDLFAAEGNDLFADKLKSNPSFLDDVLKGAKGTAAALGDIASGIVKIPVAAALTVGDTLVNPGKTDIQTRWEAAQKSMEDVFPSFGKGMEDNKGYTAPMLPFEKYGEAANWAANKASMGNRDVEGALNVGANFLPIPFLGKAAKGVGKVIETVDPGLRNVKAPKDLLAPAPDNVQARIDALKANETQAKAGWDEVVHTKTKAEALADDATVARLEAAIAKQNPEQPVIRVGKDQEAYHTSPEVEVARNAAEERMLAENEAAFAERQQQPDPIFTTPNPEKTTTSFGEPLPIAGREFPKENIQVVEKPALQTAVEKISGGRKFDMTAEERIAWEHSQANLVDAEGVALRSPDGALRSQRGSSQMLTDISQAIVDLGKKLGSMRREVSPDTSFVSKLPGLRAEADALVKKPPAAKDVLEKARAEGDGPSLFKDWQSGLALAGQKLASTMVTNAAQHLNYSVNRGNYIIRQAIYPLEKAFARLSGRRLNDLYSIIHSEMMGRHEFTPEQLSRITDNADILKTREAFRKVWDVLYEETKAQYEAMKKTPPTKLEAYMASIFKGDYHIPVYDKKGKLVWYVQTPTKGTAKEAVAWIKQHYKDHPDIDVSKMSYDHDKMYQPGGRFGNAPRDVLSSWKDIAEALGDSPLSAEFKQAMEQWVANKGTHAFRQDLHHVQKKANVRGFEGDQPWLSETQNAHAWAKAQIENMQTAVRWATTQEAVGQIKEFLTDPVIQENQKNNVALTKAYMYDQMGVTQNYVRGLENWLAGSAGLSRSHVKMVSDMAKTMLYVKTLFGSLPYALATPIQAVNGSFGWFTKEFGEGNAKVQPIQFMKDIVDSMIGEHVPVTGTKIPKMSADSNAKLKWAEDNGYIHNLLHEEGASIGAHKAVDAAFDFANKTIAAPDNWTRRVIFLPFANALEASGKFPTKEAAWTRAGEITDAVAVSMRQQDRPLAFKKLGVVGDNVWTFHAPLVAQWNNMIAFKKYGDRTGNYKPLGVFLGTLGIMGGLFSLPGSKEAAFGVDLAKDVMAEAFPENYNTWDLKVALLGLLPETKLMGQSFGELATFGVGSAALNADMRSRMSNEIIDAERPLSSILPGVGVYGDMAKSAVNFAKSPNQFTGAQFAKDMAPGPTMRGLLETNLPQFKSVDQTGEENGITSYRNPHDVRNPSAHVRRTPTETLYKGMGLTRLSEATRREKDARWNKEWGPGGRVEKAKNNITENIFMDVANGVVNDAKLAKGISKYVELGGDVKTLKTALQTKLKDMNFTKMENATNKVKGYGKVMGLLERMEMDASVPE